jgi:cell division protein FtsQ
MSSVFALRRGSPRRDELGRLLTAAAITVACGLALYLGARIVALPLLTIRHVIVESEAAIPEQELLSLAGLQGGGYYHSLQTAVIEKRLEQHPLVRKAQVRKVFPDTLRIVITRREAVALVVADSAGRSVPLLVDRDGMAFKQGTSGADVDLPVISGISLEGVSPGTALPAEYASLFADLAALRAKSPSLFRLLSEVHVVDPAVTGAAAGAGQGTPPGAGISRATAAPSAAAPAVHELLLYLLSSPVRIRASGGIDDTLLKYSLMVIDLLSNQGQLKNIGELDFRGADVVYRMKEG